MAFLAPPPPFKTASGLIPGNSRSQKAVLLLVYSHQLVYLGSVEADDYFIINYNNRYTELAGFGNQFFLFFDITRDIDILIFQTFRFKILFRLMTEVTRRRTVDSDFCHGYFLSGFVIVSRLVTRRLRFGNS